ncbi:MAG: ygiD [Phenylobacterium sp.]|nr:ygiD [Phenylobacterium sp.]
MKPVARMPVLFLGHGTPLNALRDNAWTRTWQRLGAQAPRPKAIVVISGHWCTTGVRVTGQVRPPTIHDFGAFPQALFDIRYPAPGDPGLAARIRRLLAPVPAALDHDWGFDHGAWSVCSKAFPAADIPMVQLSVDIAQPPRFHFDLGARLTPLREAGVLILASGNVVHNLQLRERDAPFAYDWATDFNDFIRDALLAGRMDAVIDYAGQGLSAALAVPTPDHFYPLLYACGAADGDAAAIEVDDVYQGSMSMMSVSFGMAAALDAPRPPLRRRPTQ